MGDRMEFYVEVLAMQIWNVTTDRAQRLDEKMGSLVYLLSLFLEL